MPSNPHLNPFLSLLADNVTSSALASPSLDTISVDWYQSYANRPKFRVTTAKKDPAYFDSHTWDLLSTPNRPTFAFCRAPSGEIRFFAHDSNLQTGYGGALFTIPIGNGRVAHFKGPWSSNPESVFRAFTTHPKGRLFSLHHYLALDASLNLSHGNLAVDTFLASLLKLRPRQQFLPAPRNSNLCIPAGTLALAVLVDDDSTHPDHFSWSLEPAVVLPSGRVWVKPSYEPYRLVTILGGPASSTKPNPTDAQLTPDRFDICS